MTPSENLVTQKEKIFMNRLNENGYIQDLSYNNFEFKNLHLVKGNTVHFFTEHNIILMQFCLQGECLLKSSNEKKPLSFKNDTYNTMYISKGDLYIAPVSNDVRLLNIYIDENFFFRQMPENHSALNRKQTNTFGSIFTKNLYINAKLTNILNEITNCEFEGHLKNLYLKAKIIELIAIQLSQEEEGKITALKPSEIEKMITVKELIENNLDQSYSLSYLARIVGTNEQYLKKHFKMLYGNTVFGYSLTCKMQKAKDMLLNEKHRIAEVATNVGYTHATHFTNAFKKFFGYLPSTLKTKILFGTYFSLNFKMELLELLIAT